jgi:hypothetical protein
MSQMVLALFNSLLVNSIPLKCMGIHLLSSFELTLESTGDVTLLRSPPSISHPPSTNVRSPFTQVLFQLRTSSLDRNLALPTPEQQRQKHSKRLWCRTSLSLGPISLALSSFDAAFLSFMNPGARLFFGACARLLVLPLPVLIFV